MDILIIHVTLYEIVRNVIKPFNTVCHYVFGILVNK